MQWTKIYEKWIKNQSKIRSIKNRPKSRFGGVLEASWRRLGASWGVLEAFLGVLGGLEPSWGRLEGILKRLGGVLGSSWRRPGTVLGTSWSVLGPLGASCGRLGGILCLIFTPKWVKFRYAILDVILQLIFDGFCLQKSMPELWKIIKFYWKNSYVLLSGCFNIILFLDVILVSTWVHFRLQNPSTSWHLEVQRVKILVFRGPGSESIYL